jgi:hypothetical protein
MMTTGQRAIRVLSPNRGGGTILLMMALHALSTQFRNLRPSLAQLIKGVVQLGVEHGDQVDHAALLNLGLPSPTSETITPPVLPIERWG